MFPEERKSEILKLVQAGKPVKVGELSLQFAVSETTVRRDLQEMEDAGLLQRTHGGAILAQLGHEPSFQEKEIRLLEEKRNIARVAADMVEDGETVLLDAGTTTLELAKALQDKKITVATNSMDIAQVFENSPDVEVLILGGTWRKATRSLVGYLANETLGRIHFDKVFLAANGLDGMFGATTPNAVEAETKRHMVLAGQDVILVVDHSKIGQKGLYRICALDELSAMVTDAGIGVDELRNLQQYVKVVVADSE